MANEDVVKVRVAELIDSIFGGSDDEIQAAFERLEGLDAGELIGELFLWVEDVTEDIDIDRLIASAEVPLPPNPRQIVDAIRARDMKALESATSQDDLNTVVSAVINVIVSLKDAREQTDPKYAQRTRRRSR